MTTDFIVGPKETRATSHLNIIAVPEKGKKPERFVYTVDGTYDEEYKTIQQDMDSKSGVFNTNIQIEKIRKIDIKLGIALITIIAAVIIGVISIIVSIRGTNKLDETLNKNNTELIESFKNNHTELMEYLIGEE